KHKTREKFTVGLVCLSEQICTGIAWKFGVGKLSDIAAPHRERVQKSKPNFCRVPLHIGEDVSYFANVDTTFALYRNVRFYHRGPSIRMAGRYEFLHLPWYYEAGHIPKDEQYYFNHAINVSTTKYFMEHPEKS
ncbi:hypothetical protein, partial [uncultured Selenomonas sp.]|uniref:hypothetical protein n=1 Tax=uncultured Selenomonas sp. TaxID=159275 RepID=UPI0025EF1031